MQKSVYINKQVEPTKSDLRSNKDSDLTSLLNHSQTAMHPFVIGEIAPGNLNNRNEILSTLQKLPMIPAATDTEVLFFIEQRQLADKGIGYVDAHLLAATALAPPLNLWTRDQKLQAIATSLDLAYKIN